MPLNCNMSEDQLEELMLDNIVLSDSITVFSYTNDPKEIVFKSANNMCHNRIYYFHSSAINEYVFDLWDDHDCSWVTLTAEEGLLMWRMLLKHCFVKTEGVTDSGYFEHRDPATGF